MKTREEIIKDISIILSTIPELKKRSDDRLRCLAAIEGFLIVLGELHMHQKLDYLQGEGYEQCILRHARACLQKI